MGMSRRAHSSSPVMVLCVTCLSALYSSNKSVRVSSVPALNTTRVFTQDWELCGGGGG